ncbi:MAG: glycosyltransferase [Candidatus Sumerlaeota bacterium]|nr:glycosyltransferase [Candidatus Sumerlaeota bacterium]
MKLLILLNSYEIDGPGRLALDLAARFVGRHGLTCETAALSRGGPLEESFEQAGIAAQVIGGPSLPSMAGRLMALLRAGRYDVVHTHLLRADLLGRWAAARAGVRVIVSTEHGVHAWASRGAAWRPWIARAYRWTARRASAIVAVSRFVAEQLRVEGIPPGKIHLIPNGVDMDRFRPLDEVEKKQARREFGVDPEARLLVAAGMMTPLKGHRLLCQALAAALREKALADVRMLIAGDGPERRLCEEWIAAQGLGDRVRFLGVVDEGMPRLLGAADLLVQPSRMESFGLAAAEAMACAVPAVACRVGALPELIEDGKDGFLVAPESLDALAAGIVNAVDDMASLREMGRRAAQRVRRDFDIESTAAQYAELYRALLARGRQ